MRKFKNVALMLVLSLVVGTVGAVTTSFAAEKEMGDVAKSASDIETNEETCKISAVLEQPVSGGDYDIYLYQYGDDGSLSLISYSLYSGSTMENLSAAGDSGFYFLRVVPQTAATEADAVYFFMISLITECDACEPDDMPAFAVEYSNSIDVNNTIDNIYDQDWSKLTVSTGGTHIVSLSNIPDECTYNMYIFDSSLNFVAGMSCSENKVGTVDLETGDYYVKVASAMGYSTSQSYNLKIMRRKSSSSNMMFTKTGQIVELTTYFLTGSLKNGKYGGPQGVSSSDCIAVYMDNFVYTYFCRFPGSGADYDWIHQPFEDGEYNLFYVDAKTGKANKGVAFPKDNNKITEDSIIGIGKNKFSTIFGATTESKYGYAAQLDSVSRDYAAAMSNHDYATAAGIDVISALNEKYQSIKAEIEEKYSGEEKDARLSELDDNYKFILDSNVISSTDLAIKNESAINKLRNAFAKAYDNAQNTKSSQFIKTAYGSLANWSGVCEEIDAQLKSYKELFEQFKEILYSSQGRSGGKEYAGSLLKSINSGLAGVKDQNDTLEKGVNGSGSQRAKELWGLIEKKAQAYFSNNNLYKSDEEKYQSFLKDTAHTSAIDNRLDKILKEILGEE